MHRPFTAVLVLIAGSVHAADGDASPSSLKLSLKDALSLARERAPAVVLAKQRVEIARGRLLGVEPWLADNPSFGAGAAARINATETSADVDLSLSQAFELGGQQRARRSSAEAAIAEALAISDDVARLALESVGEAFVAARAAESSVDLATQTHARADGLFTIAGRRHAAGEASGVDVQLATAQLARAQARVASSRAERARAFGALRVALGLPAHVELVLVQGVDGGSSALEGRPHGGERADLRVLRAQRERAVAEGWVAEGSAWPTVQATAGYSLDDGDQLVGGSLSIPIPVFARGQGDAAAAHAEVAALDVEIAALSLSAQTDLAAARSALVERRAARVAMADGVAAAQESARLARRGYEAGDSSLADLLVIEREALSIQEEQITLQSDEAKAALAVLIRAGATP